MAEITSPASQLGWPGRLLFLMTLRKKTLLVVTVTLIALVVVLFFSIQSIVMGSIEDLERRDVTTQVQRVNEALDNRLSAMDQKLRVEANPGRASNRELYAAALENEISKVSQTHGNKLAEFIANLDMDVFLFSYSPDNIRWEQGYDDATRSLTPIPEGLLAQLGLNSPLLNPPKDDSSLVGLVLVPEGPMLVASVRILAQKEGGTIHDNAAMVMGRFLDKDEILKLEEQTQLDLAVTVFGDVQNTDVRSLPGRSPLADITEGQVHVLPSKRRHS